MEWCREDATDIGVWDFPDAKTGRRLGRGPQGSDVRPWVRGGTVAASFLLILYLSAHPASAHTGYHHNGAQTTVKFYGGRGTFEVANPSVPAVSPSGKVDHFVARILVKKSPGSGPWIEVGWGERSDVVDPVTGFRNNFIYVFDTVHTPTWHIYNSQYPVAAGDIISVRVKPYSSSCTAGDSSCKWVAQLYTGGEWKTLHAVTLAMDNRVYVEEYAEVQNLSSGSHWEISTFNNCDSSSNPAVKIYNTKLRTSAGSWVNWTNSNTATGAVSPYYVNWINNYYKFCAHRTPPSGSAPDGGSESSASEPGSGDSGDASGPTTPSSGPADDLLPPCPPVLGTPTYGDAPDGAPEDLTCEVVSDVGILPFDKDSVLDP